MVMLGDLWPRSFIRMPLHSVQRVAAGLAESPRRSLLFQPRLNGGGGADAVP
jgi:hypothetical protein